VVKLKYTIWLEEGGYGLEHIFEDETVRKEFHESKEWARDCVVRKKYPESQPRWQ